MLGLVCLRFRGHGNFADRCSIGRRLFLGRRFIGFLNDSHGRERWGLDDLFGDCHRFFDHDSFDYFFSSGYLLLNRFLDRYGLDNRLSSGHRFLDDDGLDDLFNGGHRFFDHDSLDDFFNSGYLLLDYYGFNDFFRVGYRFLDHDGFLTLGLFSDTLPSFRLDGLALYHTFRVSKFGLRRQKIRRHSNRSA